jgi:hypothetical protein
MMSDLFLENLTFLFITTVFLLIVGYAWRDTKPYQLPQPLPGWFKVWFTSVQLLGGVIPLITLILYGFIWGYGSVISAFMPFLIILGLQIIAEFLTLRRFQSPTWVMVPYLYLPYRIWQLYEGLQLINPTPELIWVRYVLILNLVVWIGNYLLDLSQLPRLFRWEGTQTE